MKTSDGNFGTAVAFRHQNKSMRQSDAGTPADFRGGVEDPRRSNGTGHVRREMLTISLLITIGGGEGCSDMALFGCLKEPFQRQLLALEHGIPSHDSFSDLFDVN